MLARIADNVGHRRFQPMLVNLVVAFFAGLRAYVMGGAARLRLLRLLLVRQRSKAANVKNQPPAVIVLRLMRIAPSGHAS